MTGRPENFVSKDANWECCMRNMQGNFICTTKVFDEDYYYMGEKMSNDDKYVAFCQKHWELQYHEQVKNQ